MKLIGYQTRNKWHTSFSILARTAYGVPSYPMNLTATTKIGFGFQFQYDMTRSRAIWYCCVWIYDNVNSNGKGGTFCAW